MTAFEIVSIIISLTSLLIAFGMFVVALLAFLDKRNKRKSEKNFRFRGRRQMGMPAFPLGLCQPRK